MRNPFRRQTDTAAPTLRERATNLRARFASTIRKPEPATEVDPADTVRDFAGIELRKYAFDFPLKAPDAWNAQLAAHGLSMHLADRTLRMTKPELIAFIREAGARDAGNPETIFQSLDASQQTLEGWANLLGLARARYIVGASAECLEPTTSAPAAESPQPEPVDTAPAPVPADLTTAILDGWAAWGGTLDKMGDDYSDEEANAAVAPMNRLVRSAAELPATAENIAAKALAYAWRDWVSTERPGQPRDAYDLDGRLVYDLHAAIMARGSKPEAVQSNPGPAKLPLNALVPMVDFAGATMRELWAIREAANLICEVSNAKTWQGCNRLPDHPSGAVIHNEAGKLMRWVSDAMCHVVTAAQDEARRRSPESSDDRETRLSMLAVSAIDNDDPAETAAFARELLAMVEA